MSVVSDWERDLDRVEVALREPEGDGPDAVTRGVLLHLQRASLTGRPEAYDEVARVADRALARLGPWPDLCLLRADLAVRQHRLADARAELDRAPEVLGTTQARAVLADVLVQEGSVDEAEQVVAALVDEERTWDHLARLAHLALLHGDVERADATYAEAEDEITAKSMRSFAWVEVERGRLRVLTGEHDRARAHYERAERAYSGHWTVPQRLGELDALTGRLDDAVSRLSDVLDRTGRPEVAQALADVLDASDDVDGAETARRTGEKVRIGHKPQRRADALRAQALAAYRASAAAGEVQYLHHLAETGEPAEAVEAARRDVALRPNHLTRSALAVALLRAGEPGEAEAEMDRALASGLRDPRLLARAARVPVP